MPRRGSSKSPPPLEVRTLGQDEINRGVARLKKRIEDVQALDPTTVPANDQRVDNVERAIRNAVLEIFGENSPEYRDNRYHKIWKGVERVGMDSRYMQKCFADGIPQTVMMLEGLLQGLAERRAEQGESPAAAGAATARERVVQKALRHLTYQLERRNDEALHTAIRWFRSRPDAKPLHQDSVANGWFAESLRAVQPDLADPDEQAATSDLYLELRADGGVGLPTHRLELGFSIIEELSAGHYGKVCKATVNGMHPPLVVAVKRPLERDALRLEAFQKEANCLSRLANPGHEAIPRLVAVSYVPGEEFLAMQFMPGKPLGEWLRSSPSMSVRRQVLERVALALEYAHERKIYHRDLKLGNILATDNGVVSLLDFGLSKTNLPEDLTHEPRLLANVRNAPPECVESVQAGQIPESGEEYDAWSLGCIAFEIFYGRHPFEVAQDVLGTARAIQTAPVDPLEIDGLPSIAPLIRELLSRNPDERPSMAEVVSRLSGPSRT